jgi:hypothetical protein
MALVGAGVLEFTYAFAMGQTQDVAQATRETLDMTQRLSTPLNILGTAVSFGVPALSASLARVRKLGVKVQLLTAVIMAPLLSTVIMLAVLQRFGDYCCSCGTTSLVGALFVLGPEIGRAIATRLEPHEHERAAPDSAERT